MIFYPNEPQDISEYSLAIIASNNVYSFLKQHVLFLINMQINFKTLFVGDAGLLEGQIREITDSLRGRVVFISLKHQNAETGFKTQSDQYRRIIDNRIDFLKTIFLRDDVHRVVQLDADTSIIRNDFSMLDKSCDISLTVRPVSPGDHILGQFQVDYPNCGVIFWNNPRKCLDFLDAWQDYKNENPPKGGQYEQNYFLHACLTDSFKKLNIQKIHCAYYNCYNRDWLNQKTSIIHYKGNSALFGPGGGDFHSRSDYLNEVVIGKKLRFV